MIVLKPGQEEVFCSPARFRVLVAGRRFGKTYLALVELCQAAWKRGRLAWYVAPSYKQAKRIAWRPLKEMTRPYWADHPNETDLRIDLITGGTIALRGADNYDSLRGDGLDFVILDEYASMDPAAWTQVLRPSLADREGRALFIGTPQGYNHFHELYQKAQNQPDWAAFQFTTAQGGNVRREELESAARELDERTYRQEFEARFENLTAGQIYFAFDRNVHVKPCSYTAQHPLFWSLDFNLNHAGSVLGQKDGDRVYIIDEIVLTNCENQSTWAACEAFQDRTARWLEQSRLPIQVDVYGDATGERGHSSASHSDWELVRRFFEQTSRNFRAAFKKRHANPAVKDRVNAVNGMLRNHAGDRRLVIDPKCKHLIEDLERLTWKADAHGVRSAEIDKSDPARSHTSDALGYMIEKEFGMRPKAGPRPGYVA